MKNYLADHDTLNLIAPSGGVESGVPVCIEDLFVIPKQTAPAGQSFVGMRYGIFALPVEGSASVVTGKKAYWSKSKKAVTSAAENNLDIGHFYQSSGDGLVEVIVS
ncbi:DUF2190 family protein [Spartinivicinus ruber]|uniref:DUF2190 family protein n=1 Tax=Spartinivicinus ruber TaxID=2683272 RepID=UPI0013D1BFB3|nr:capsid cement protein [Spartinivicinus ruber]